MRFETEDGRPFAGNAAAKSRLESYIDNGVRRLPHALLLEGPRGSGRRTLARIVARALVCRAEDAAARPCGECPACAKARSGNHPDILEVGGETGGPLLIDDMRALRRDAYIIPNEAPYRVMILGYAGAMTPERQKAQNALLKLIEEPPRHLVVILTGESRSQLLETVQSRVAVIPLAPVEEGEALPVLRELCPQASEEQARRALAVFGGMIGEAARGLTGEDGEQAGMAKVLELAPKMARAVAAPQEFELMRLTGRLERDKTATDGVLRALALLFRDALAMRTSPTAPALSIDPEAAREIGRSLPPKRLMALMREVENLQKMRMQNLGETLFLTLLCSRLRQAAGR